MAGFKSQNPPSVATAYEPHPIAMMFPMMDDAALAELAADIKARRDKINRWSQPLPGLPDR